MAGQSRPANRKRISVSDFLYLAMVCFTSPEEPNGRHCRNAEARSDRPQSREPASRSRGGAGNGGGRSKDRSRGRGVAGRDIAIPDIDPLSSGPTPGYGVYQQSPPRANAGSNTRERGEIESALAERGIGRRTKEVEERVVPQARSRPLEREGGRRREVGVDCSRDSLECRGARDGNALQADSIETSATGGVRKEESRSGVVLGPNASGVRLDVACEKALWSPSATWATSKSPTAVLHVETGFLEVGHRQTQVSPGGRTADDGNGTPMDLAGQSTRSPRELISAMNRDQNEGSTREWEEKRDETERGTSSTENRGMNALGRRGGDREVTTRATPFFFSTTPIHNSGAHPGRKQECGGKEGRRARTVAQGSRGGGVSLRSGEAKVAGGDRASCKDEDLTSVGGKSNSTYASAEEGEEHPRPRCGDGSGVGKRVAGPTSGECVLSVVCCGRLLT